MVSRKANDRRSSPFAEAWRSGLSKAMLEIQVEHEIDHEVGPQRSSEVCGWACGLVFEASLGDALGLQV